MSNIFESNENLQNSANKNIIERVKEFATQKGVPFAKKELETLKEMLGRAGNNTKAFFENSGKKIAAVGVAALLAATMTACADVVDYNNAIDAGVSKTIYDAAVQEKDATAMLNNNIVASKFKVKENGRESTKTALSSDVYDQGFFFWADNLYLYSTNDDLMTIYFVENGVRKEFTTKFGEEEFNGVTTMAVNLYDEDYVENNIAKRKKKHDAENKDEQFVFFTKGDSLVVLQTENGEKINGGAMVYEVSEKGFDEVFRKMTDGTKNVSRVGYIDAIVSSDANERTK